MIADRIENWDILEMNARSFYSAITIHTDKEYDEVMEYAEVLLDKVHSGNTDYEPLLIMVTDIIAKYEDEHYPLPKLSAVDCIKALMEEHGHKQSDLQDVAVASTISAILAGKRELNLAHIKALSKKYNRPYEYFID